MQHHLYSVRYSVVQINFSLLTTTLYSLDITTLVYYDTKYSLRDVVTDLAVYMVAKFADSNPTEAFGFFRAKKSSARLPSEGK